MTDAISGGPSGEPRRTPAWLVVVVAAGPCAAVAGYVAVLVDVVGGRLVSVVGATPTAGGLALAWSRDSAWLAVLARGQSAGSTIAVWHVGEQVMHTIPGPADAWSLVVV